MPKKKPLSNAGLLKKYIIIKADGTKADPKAEYFVLRLDLDNAESDTDRAHRNACREAARMYSQAIKPWLPTLAREIRDRYPLLHLVSCIGQPIAPDKDENRHR